MTTEVTTLMPEFTIMTTGDGYYLVLRDGQPVRSADGTIRSFSSRAGARKRITVERQRVLRTTSTN